MLTTILITDLTCMHEDRVCIAGVNQDLEAIRPVMPDHVQRSHLYLDNGLIRPRAVLELWLETDKKIEAPHFEDKIWTYTDSRFLRLTSEENWHRILSEIAFPSVKTIFGTPLQNERRNIRRGTGKRSLGTLKPRKIDEIYQRVGRSKTRAQFRLKFQDDNADFDFPINDFTLIRYIERLQKNGISIDYAMALLSDRFHRSETWLRVGLTRNFFGWHWIQINGIYTFPDYLAGQSFADFDKA